MALAIWCCLRRRNAFAAVRAGAALPALLLLLGASLYGQGRWKIQYFYDKSDSQLEIRDIQCSSVQRCIAAGVIEDRSGHSRGATLITSDGGQHWSLESFAERPVSLFLLDESTGWMVTDRGIWMTRESGRAWSKMYSLKGLGQVYFLDAAHGFAIGYPKAFYQTTDGGKTWTKVPAASQTAGRPEETAYDCIAFSGQQGIVVGRTVTENDDRPPIWINPNTARNRRERETPVVQLETSDGGQSWQSSTSPAVGTIARLLYTKDGYMLILVEYHDYYALPSAVVKIKLGYRGSETIFGERDRAVSDIALLPNGGALIASIEPPGNSNQVPIPGKLKMLRTGNLKLWEEMDVDYRAVAQRAILAVPNAHRAFVATDTGMILTLDEAGAP